MAKPKKKKILGDLDPHITHTHAHTHRIQEVRLISTKPMNNMKATLRYILPKELLVFMEATM